MAIVKIHTSGDTTTISISINIHVFILMFSENFNVIAIPNVLKYITLSQVCYKYFNAIIRCHI